MSGSPSHIQHNLVRVHKEIHKQGHKTHDMWLPNPHLRDVCHSTSSKRTKIQNGWFLSKYMMPVLRNKMKFGQGYHCKHHSIYTLQNTPLLSTMEK